MVKQLRFMKAMIISLPSVLTVAISLAVLISSKRKL